MTTATIPDRTAITDEQLIAGYKSMLLIRIMEQKLVEYYLKNKVMSFVHFYVGQEAVAAGVCDNLRPTDRVFGNHRSHGHYLAKGGDPTAMVAELLGRKDGCCHGKGGSMHMIDKSVHFMGSTPILGSVAPIATGSAMASKLLDSDEVTVGFFGDGASEEGEVYESVNLAALQKLPLVLVIENNLYSVMSKLRDRRSAAHSTEQVMQGLGAKYLRANGNDYLDVFKQAHEAISSARQGMPVVLECIVYRHMAHSAPISDDHANYRELDTADERQKQCPIGKTRAILMERNAASSSALDDMERETHQLCLQAIEKATQSSFPALSELYTDVYAK